LAISVATVAILATAPATVEILFVGVIWPATAVMLC
jgi:hypothetical protein